MFFFYDLKEFKNFFLENVISRRPKRLEQAYLVAKFENPECTLIEHGISNRINCLQAMI